MDPFASQRGEPEPVSLPGLRLIRQVRDQAMFVVDLHGRASSWNEGVGAILGWDEAEWIGQPARVAFSPEDVSTGVPEAELRDALDHGHAGDDRWMQRRNGAAFFALGSVTTLLDDDARPVGFLKAVRDGTRERLRQQHRQEQDAREQASRLHAEQAAASLGAAVEAITDAVLIGHADGTVHCNAPALALLGVASTDELSSGSDALVRRLRLHRHRGGALLQPQEHPFALALAGQPSIAELWVRHAVNGERLPIRCAAAPIVVDGRPMGAVAVLSDLSQRLQLDSAGRALSQVESRLHERNAQLQAVVDRVRDYAIYTINPHGRISSWHQGAALMKGYSDSEAIGMRFSRLFTLEDRAAGRPEMELEIAARSGEFTGEGRRLRKDGSIFEAAVVLTALRSPAGELLGFLKLTQDISARKRLEREREELLHEARSAHAEAQRASHWKDEFLATISHELRTPLSAIIGWAQVLERGQSDPATLQHGLLAISRNARIQVQLIEDLLDMSRIEAGQLRLELQRVEMGGILAAAIDSALPAATAKRITLRTVFAPGVGEVLGDAARLQQVVGNLLSNAIKFTPPGGRIFVSNTQSGGMVQVTVSDTGQGIQPEFLPRIFDRFQQQDASITRRHSGLGIGLAVVWHLVRLHAGSVEAHSPGPGLGASFVVRLPALPATGDERPDHRSDTPLSAVRLDGVCLLLVDDEADIRAVTAHVLQDAGARVLVADSAEQALQLLKDSRADPPLALISDIGMPGTDGYDLLKRVRALSADEGGLIPAAAFTAYTRPEDGARAREAGYQLQLPKPSEPDALVRAVAGLVGRA